MEHQRLLRFRALDWHWFWFDVAAVIPEQRISGAECNMSSYRFSIENQKIIWISRRGDVSGSGTVLIGNSATVSMLIATEMKNTAR